MRIVVLGAGAVGAYYGGQLARIGHDVMCFARGANLTAIRERGLEIRTPEGAVRPRLAATDRIEELGPAAYAILAVKSYSLSAIAPVVRRMAEQGAVIVPFLNGVETAKQLWGHGVPRAAVIGGVTTISVARVQPGVVERRSPFQIVVLGEFDGRPTERVSAIATAFRDAGVDARTSDRIVVELWQKFVFIAALAAACGLARSPVGPLRTSALGRRLLGRAVTEVVQVAQARDIPLPPNEVARVLALIDGLPPGMRPSFLLDLEAGGPTELDILSGAVSRFADQVGVATPVHDTATAALGPRAQPTAV